jgi:hypothetical protein
MITLALSMVIWGLAYRWVSLTRAITASRASAPTLLGVS